MPDRAVDRRLVARMDVELRPPSPFLARRNQLEFDDAFGAKVHLDRAVGGLRTQRDDDAEALPERGLDLGLEDDLPEVGRGDLLLALADEDDVDRKLLARRLEGVERRQQRGLRPLGVGGAATDDHLAEAGLVHQPSLEWRRAPLGRIVLLHVVHEIDREPSLGSGVERGEYARLARGGNQVHLLEAGLPRELCHVLGALGIVPVLGGDRRERDPVLQHLDRHVVAPGDRGDHGGLVRLLEGLSGPVADRECGRADCGALQEGAAAQIAGGNVVGSMVGMHGVLREWFDRWWSARPAVCMATAEGENQARRRWIGSGHRRITSRSGRTPLEAAVRWPSGARRGFEPVQPERHLGPVPEPVP